MLLDRNVRRSLYDYARSLLLSPPAGTFNSPFNVYTEANLRDSAFTPSSPFVFMVDRQIAPTVARLPLIIVEMDSVPKVSYELGNRSGHMFSADLNIFGPTRGVRDDLGSFFRDYWDVTFSIKDYRTAGSPVFDTAELMDEPSLQTISLGDDVGKEGSLYNFCVVSVECLLRT